MMTRRAPIPTTPAPVAPRRLSLEDRLATDLAMTKGRMELVVVVADGESKERAEAWLAGKQHRITITTASEFAAMREQT